MGIVVKWLNTKLSRANLLYINHQIVINIVKKNFHVVSEQLMVLIMNSKLAPHRDLKLPKYNVL